MQINYAAIIYPPDLTIGDINKPKPDIKALKAKIKYLADKHGFNKYKKK